MGILQMRKLRLKEVRWETRTKGSRKRVQFLAGSEPSKDREDRWKSQRVPTGRRKQPSVSWVPFPDPWLKWGCHSEDYSYIWNRCKACICILIAIQMFWHHVNTTMVCFSFYQNKRHSEEIIYCLMLATRQPLHPLQPALSSSEFGSKIPLQSALFNAENKLQFKHEFYYFQIEWCMSYFQLFLCEQDFFSFQGSFTFKFHFVFLFPLADYISFFNVVTYSF